MQQKGRAHVQLELREPIRLGQVRVPQTDRAVQRQLPGQQVIHPSEGELQVIDSMLHQVLMQLNVDPLDELLQLVHLRLDAQLSEYVIILQAVQEL